MKTSNWTQVSEFVFLGITEDPKLQLPLFLFFLLVYVVTLLCNTGIIILVWLKHCLHTPMYFLLCTLSFVDICLSSITVPIMLSNFLSTKKIISFRGCVAQMFLLFAIGSTEVFLLAVMAYDRYTAICNPLLYPVIMSNQACIYLLVRICIIAVVNAVTQTVCTFTLRFCKSNIITHFCCEIHPILKLACSDTTWNEVVLSLVAGGLIMVSVSCILVSYASIISAILKIHSTEGRWRAFSTCSSHLVCVTIFFGTLVFMYGMPNTKHSMAKDRAVSVLYMVIIPMLNPLIYSLRNQEIKGALVTGFRKACFSR
ncbi:olfactory receptor 5G9-like [Pleurodeles waltl]|uniref:olfactory receptor 5G9-like n=1 Tax=Pleurodeles waltl TaxID=8319 RepID=UPI0037097C41